MTSFLGSCKYGAECGLTLYCECDCCLDVHPCECGRLDDQAAEDELDYQEEDNA